jgi:colicin import membrane protein
MIRARENPIAVKAGALALLMHVLFFVLLLVSFSWKHVQPPLAAQVELWDSLPQPKAETPPPPEIKPEPKPEPPPPEIKPEPKPEPPPEPKAEIQVKPKPPKPEVKKPPKEEPKKPDPALKKQEEEKKRKEELEQLKKAMLNDLPEQHDEMADTKKLNDAKAAANAKAAADAKRAADMLAASSGVVDEYKAKIVAKIKRYVNKEVCGTGKPELLFAIALLPSGEVSGTPRLLKSSGIAACDQAVERAILQAQPLPLPPQGDLLSQFRDLNLKFRPNESQ